jgi:hypothetical protein
MTQRERVLRQLQRAGRVLPYEDFTLPTVDGLKPIARVAPRIEELRSEGYDIRTRLAANGTAVYVLADQQTVLPVAA